MDDMFDSTTDDDARSHEELLRDDDVRGDGHGWLGGRGGP